MQQHDWSSTSPKEPMLHLSLSPRTGSQMQLASSSRHWCLHIEQPQAQHLPTSTLYYESTSPPEVWDLLVSDASWYHYREAQNHSPEHSLSPFLAGGMILECWIPVNLQATTENSSLSTVLDFILNPKLLILKKLPYSLSLTFSPSLASLNLFEQCLRLGDRWALPLSDCLFKMNRFMYSPIVSRFGASAKWLNVNAFKTKSFRLLV